MVVPAARRFQPPHNSDRRVQHQPAATTSAEAPQLQALRPHRRPAPVETSAADAIIDILEGEGVDLVFGVPGGPLTGFFEALRRHRSIRFVLAKHEGGAAFMAAAYARVTRRLAVCCVTSGPGATNALTGVASAYTEGLPVLLLTGQVATNVFGKGAIQESSVYGVDLVQVFRPVTKLSAMFPHAARCPDLVRGAIRMALSGRRGPVHLSMPADVLAGTIPYVALRPAEYRVSDPPLVDPDALNRAAVLLRDALHPCFLAGHGVALAEASDELVKLARKMYAPVATSPKGKGVFPEDDPLSLGVLGFGGHDRAQQFIESDLVDLVVIVGSSMNEFVTDGWRLHLGDRAAIVHVDIDASTIGRNYPVDVGVVGDARAVLRELADRVPTRPSSQPRISGVGPAEALRRAVGATGSQHPATPALKPQDVIAGLRDTMPEDSVLYVDTGNSILWATHYFEVRKPDTYLIDLGLGAMGSAVAGAVGVALASPGRRIVALVGDAAFAMHGCEVHTAVEARLPIVWIVLNNGGHGMVHQGESLMRGSDLGTSLFGIPLDIAAIARAVGAQAARVEDIRGFRDALERAWTSDMPTVIDVTVDRKEIPPTLARRAAAIGDIAAGR